MDGEEVLQRMNEMSPEVQGALSHAMELWEKMKGSDMDEAENDADFFQTKFYEFTKAVGNWVNSMEDVPKDVEDAKLDSRFASIFRTLPKELCLPFESELEAILSGQERDVDSTEQS